MTGITSILDRLRMNIRRQSNKVSIIAFEDAYCSCQISSLVLIDWTSRVGLVLLLCMYTLLLSEYIGMASCLSHINLVHAGSRCIHKLQFRCQGLRCQGLRLVANHDVAWLCLGIYVDSLVDMPLFQPSWRGHKLPNIHQVKFGKGQCDCQGFLQDSFFAPKILKWLPQRKSVIALPHLNLLRSFVRILLCTFAHYGQITAWLGLCVQKATLYWPRTRTFGSLEPARSTVLDCES